MSSQNKHYKIKKKDAIREAVLYVHTIQLIIEKGLKGITIVALFLAMAAYLSDSICSVSLLCRLQIEEYLGGNHQSRSTQFCGVEYDSYESLSLSFFQRLLTI